LLKREHLELREEKDGYFSVMNLRKIEVADVNEAFNWLEKGLEKRITSSTSHNTNSSRSHSIF
jgi:kinesin family protein 4/21/27